MDSICVNVNANGNGPRGHTVTPRPTPTPTTPTQNRTAVRVAQVSQQLCTKNKNNNVPSRLHAANMCAASVLPQSTSSAFASASTSSSPSAPQEEGDNFNASFRLVTIGGGAAAMSFAARARRLCESAEITVLQRGPFVSFANCGLPYHIGGTIKNEADLILNNSQSLRDTLRLTIHTNTEVIQINRQKKEVVAQNKDGQVFRISYDGLLLAPGAIPIRPTYAGCGEANARVRTLRTIEDMRPIMHFLEISKRVVIVGAGFLGLELLEQIHAIKIQQRTSSLQELSLIELHEHVLPTLDEELVSEIERDIRSRNIHLFLNEQIKRIHHRSELELVDSWWKGDHHMDIELENGRRIPADLVIFAIGIKADIQLAVNTQLHTTKTGHILVNDYMQTSDENIYAAGDGIATRDMIYPDRNLSCALGGPANRQGRLAADHIVAKLTKTQLPIPYPGTLATSIVRVFSMAAAITGWSEHRLQAAGKAFDSVIVHGLSHASYYGGAKEMILKMIYDRVDGRLLGGQVVGADGAGVDKRIDVLAMACANRMTIEQLQHIELSYAPQFNSAKDPVNVAAFAAVNQWKGRVSTIHSFDDVPTKELHVIDVRECAVAALAPLKSTSKLHVHQHPYTTLRQWLQTEEAEQLKKSIDSIVVVCEHGKTSYFASQTLQHNGFPEVLSLTGGLAAEQSVIAQNTANQRNQAEAQAEAQAQAQAQATATARALAHAHDAVTIQKKQTVNISQSMTKATKPTMQTEISVPASPSSSSSSSESSSSGYTTDHNEHARTMAMAMAMPASTLMSRL